MDPQQQQQAMGMVAGMGAAFLLIGLIVTAFVVFLFWRIFAKAGLAGALSLIVVIPGIGWVICLCILAFSRWPVTPDQTGYLAAAPTYPPAPFQSTTGTVYPPPTSTGHAPSGPPPQL